MSLADIGTVLIFFLVLIQIQTVPCLSLTRHSTAQHTYGRETLDSCLLQHETFHSIFVQNLTLWLYIIDLLFLSFQHLRYKLSGNHPQSLKIKYFYEIYTRLVVPTSNSFISDVN